ncbi:MAG: ABC transporter permease [Chloroflexaceae bacterium]|nr:ABC transporter permease [Chloroflexaceae bacterium]
MSAQQRLPWEGFVWPGLLVLFVVGVLLAPAFATSDPNAIRMDKRLAAPDAEHLLGTDHLGRDVLLRLLHGGRATLAIGLATVLLSMTLALVVGLVAGYAKGARDVALSGLLDMLLTLPGLLVTLAILGVLGTGTLPLILALIGTAWAGQARLLRAATLAIRNSSYVEAARAIGARQSHILFRHVLPNIVTPLFVLASLELAEVLLVVSALSFLGLGAQPPNADWGVMLAESRSYFAQAPWLMWAPGVCIVLYSALANLAGDSLQTLRDQSLRRI